MNQSEHNGLDAEVQELTAAMRDCGAEIVEFSYDNFTLGVRVTLKVEELQIDD